MERLWFGFFHSFSRSGFLQRRTALRYDLCCANPAESRTREAQRECKMNRWVRLCSAFVGMVMIGNLQYAWTLFAQPMVKAHAQQHWQLSDVQWGFGLFIAAGTWTMPFRSLVHR